MNAHLNQSGFTLVEVLVAATIFALAMGSITELFVMATAIQRRAAAVEHIEENAQYVIESIARELRVGTVTSGNTSCSAGPSSSNNTITINYPDPVSGVPVIATYTYTQVGGNGVINSTVGSATQQITSSDINITNFEFCVAGVGTSTMQTQVTMPMTLQAFSGQGTAVVAVSLQTTVAGRSLNP